VSPWASSLASVVAVSLVSLVGLATLSASERRVRRIATVLVSFAVGALLGDAFIHLIPEAFADGSATLRPSLLILAGMMLFFLVEKLLRHHHGSLHQHHPDEQRGRPELAVINIVGDAIHNFIDGILIAASYLASPTLGISTTVAVLFHEIPQELGDFGVLVHGGWNRRRALLYNLLSASTFLVGSILAYAASARIDVSFLLPFAAGNFVYIAASDLVPEVKHAAGVRDSLIHLIAFASGIALLYLLRVVLAE
jgi:zinc and cadmium transporter